MSGLLDAALAYARAGFPVFPVRVDKAPLTPHGFKDATTDEDAIGLWWSEFPDAGIGIPTGDATGVVVLDEDPRHAGLDSLEALLRENGPLPEGPVTRTGGGGRHFWFSHPGGGVPVSHGFRPGLDFQGDGAYVIVPPSPHLSGKAYEWEVPLLGAKLPLPPAWLLKAAVETRSSSRRFEAGAGGKISHGQHHDFIVATAASLASRIRGIGRDTLLAQVRAVVAQTLDDPEAHEGELADAVNSALAKYGKPPLEQPADGGPAPGPAPIASPGPAPFTIPSDLFVETKKGELRADEAAFRSWFRRDETFVVPIERGTFRSPADFELLRYSEGYYNGKARSFVGGRIEDAHRRVGLASAGAFREEVIKGLGATSEYHRDRTSFNPADFLCVANGVLELATRAIGPLGPDPVFTWKLPVEYDPAATCPRFEQFLAEVMPDTLDGNGARRRDLLVDLLGYLLWRKNPFQIFFLLVGDGSNGKTTLGKVLLALLGKEATTGMSLQQLSSNRFAPAELDGKLLNLCDDLPFDRPLKDTGPLKILTGDGTMLVERKGQHPFPLRFDGKLVSMANRTPPVSDDTYAFWRRPVVFKFEQTFPVGDPRRDPRLEEKLLAELPGILNLALRGLERVWTRLEFDPENVLVDAEEEWRNRADPIRAELMDSFEACPGAFVTNDRIRAWHLEHAEAEGREPLSDEALGDAVTRAFPKSRSKRKQVHGKSVWGRPGIREKLASPGGGGVLDIDLTLTRVHTPPEGENEAPPPATAISRESGGPTSPDVAGPPTPGPGDVSGLSGAGMDTPATSGDAPPKTTPPIPSSGAYVEQRSESGEIPLGSDRKRHSNCPSCAGQDHHVCYVCPACKWQDAHGDDDPA